jgi:pimeloyl-ACP methyl ester carboxylesterase
MKQFILLTLLSTFIAMTAIAQPSDKTFILVAGAGHGGWCWRKVIPLLEANGYRAIAVDVPGSGNDTDLLKNNTLEDDVKAVVNAVNSVQGKVILLGHSSGGVIVSQAAELLGKTKVDKLIYLDAFLPANGESVFSIAEKIGKRKQSPHVSTVPIPERFVFSADGRSFKWNADLVRQLFYDDCSQEDVLFAKAHMGWQSVATLATPVHLTDPVYGSIKKYYILCTLAKDLDKSSLVTDVPCEKMFQLPSSHSPFFSMPDKLVAILVALH